MSKDPNSTYYDAGGMEVLDIIKAKLTPQQYQGFLLGNVIKYSCRMNHKGTFNRDSQKCAFYANALSQFEAPADQIKKAVDELMKSERTKRPNFVAPFPLSPFYDLNNPTIYPVIT